MIKIQIFFVLMIWNLDFRACFGFRASNFEFIDHCVQVCEMDPQTERSGNLPLGIQQGGRVAGIGQIADTHD
jgi:hypothetical protein